MSFRNRFMVAGAEGVISLNVPVEGGREKKEPIRSVRLAEGSAWLIRLWRTLCSCYNRSPWFEYYRDSLQAVLFDSPRQLFDWNFRCFQWTIQQLKLPVDIRLTESYIGKNAFEGRDLRGLITPKTYRDYWPDGLEYEQVFRDRNGFLPNLSILDLLFNEGPASRDFLEKLIRR